jgi:hypothetical protein
MMRALPILACLTLAACQQQESTTPAQGEDVSPAPPPEAPAPPPEVSDDPATAASYVGMPVKQASDRADQAGIRWRIVEEDGKSRPVTKDFRPDRLNFAVAAGKIIRVTKG